MVIWLIGVSGSGKTEIGRRVYKKIKKTFSNTVFIDGDTIREINDHDLGHTIKDRKRNSDRICNLCKMLDSQDINVVCAILSIFPEAQEWNRQNYKKYFQIYINVPWKVIKLRDNKNIYDRAEKGELRNVVGVDIKFPEPRNSDLIIQNDRDLSDRELDQIAENILGQFFKKYRKIK